MRSNAAHVCRVSKPRTLQYRSAKFAVWRGQVAAPNLHRLQLNNCTFILKSNNEKGDLILSEQYQ